MRATMLSCLMGSVIACTGSEKDPVEPPPPAVVETADTAADAEPPDPDPDPPGQFDTYDTGTFIDLNVEGWAFVDPGISLNGWEAIVARWSRAPSTRPPGCVQAWEAKDWLNDPIRANQADPLAANLSACEGCTFTFTVSFTNPTEGRELPWAALDTPADTDPPDTDVVDTDPADTDALDTDVVDTDPDTDEPPPATGDGPFLNCDNLKALGLLSSVDPASEEWFGYGFDPTVVDPSDPTTGAWMFWDPNNGAWFQYPGDATFQDSVFRWQLTYGQYVLY